MTSTDSRGTSASALFRRLPEYFAPKSGLVASADPTKPSAAKKAPPKKNQPVLRPPINWKVFVFFLPSRGTNPKPPKLPNGKHWLELLLMLLKVMGAIYALVKAVGVLS